MISYNRVLHLSNLDAYPVFGVSRDQGQQNINHLR